MNLDFDHTSPNDRYKLLTALVVPRPIALVTSIDAAGIVNAAPYSFFNVFSEDPAVCILGIQRRPNGELKDTAANIEKTDAFVVNLVSEEIAQAMNICAIDFPAGQSELEAAGLKVAPSAKVAAPRLAQSKAALECRMHTTLMLGADRRLVVGLIEAIYVDDEIIDRDRLHIDHQRYRPVGRLSGNRYCETTEVFSLKRETFADWIARQ